MNANDKTRLEAMEQGAQSLQAELEQAMRGEGAPDNKQEAHEADATTEGRKPMEWREVRVVLSNQYGSILEYVYKALTTCLDHLTVEYKDNETGETIVSVKKDEIWTDIKFVAYSIGFVIASICDEEESDTTTRGLFVQAMKMLELVRDRNASSGCLEKRFLEDKIRAYVSDESKYSIDVHTMMNLSIIFHRLCEAIVMLSIIEDTYRELTRQDDEADN